MIDFFGGLRGDRLFLASLKLMMTFWEWMRMKKSQSHIMVDLKGRFKVETEDKFHILPLVYITYSGIEVRI